MPFDHTKIEPKWQKYWDENKTFKTDCYDDSKPKYYCMDMFPYPSGNGLHVGHPEGYTATDIVSRMKRMQGYNVLHPMGFDSFGLPAEQFAIQTGHHPAEFTKKNIDVFRKQIKSLGFSYDWDREIATSDPEYYKWTQWIFTKLYDQGLAYIDEIPVNWCPELKAVLANEEVIDGKSERGGYPVIRKPMRQWVLKITEYAERLLADLDEAERCLEANDPILTASIKELSTLEVAQDDNFLCDRQMRMNYYAVCALKARVQLWLGNKSEALKYAQKVIDAKDPNGNAVFRLGTTTDCANGDLIFSSEHIFNLNVYNLSDFKISAANTFYTNSTTLKYFWASGTTDIRRGKMWKEVYDNYWWTYYYYMTKYTQATNMPVLAKNSIPLFRLAEMYLIAMECGSIQNANDLYKEVCIARDITPVTFGSTEELSETLILEYNREFYGEGQAFYAYKRLGRSKIFGTSTVGSALIYVLPLPKAESLYIQ